MNTKIFQQALKLFFALTLMVGLLVPVNSTSKAAPLAVYTDPADIQYVNQWSLKDTAYAISAPTAWAITTGSAATIVAVLDTGVTNHEDLDSNRVLINNGYDFVSSNDNDGTPGRDDDASDPGDYGTCGSVITDSTWQGTHVAGIIGAATNGANIGVAGIDWSAKILPVRTIGTCGSTTATDIVDGMKWAAGLVVAGPAQRVWSGDTANNPANVIHVSASVPPTTACNGYQADIDAIITSGAVIVAAAGKNVTNAVNFPANCNGVIAVAATDAYGMRASFSNYGAAVDISAPGSALSTTNGSSTTPNATFTYETMEGTAVAAAHVSGVVSLMFAANPDITPVQVEKFLKKTPKAFATGTGTVCTTSTCGSGILDAGKAVEYAERPDLVITNAVLVPIDPSLGDMFQVDVTVKNQGGSVSQNKINLQIYVDRNPVTTLFVDEREGEGGHLVVAEGSEEGDLGEFLLDRGDQFVTLPEAEARTFSVRINNTVLDENPNPWTESTPVPWGDGTHDLYVYVDSHGTIIESDEKNNYYSTDNFVSAKPVVINPIIEGALLYPKKGQSIGEDYNPTFKWNKWKSVNGKTEAEMYQLYISGPGGTKLLDQWYQASSICDPLMSTCSLELGPTLTLGGGTYAWFMRAYSVAGGYTVWSNGGLPTNFTTITTIPAAAVLTAPKDTVITGYTPNYIWEKVPTATYYRLHVSGPGGKIILDQWYLATSICDETTCQVLSPMLGAGAHVWFVQTYNSVGLGPWSNGQNPTNFSTSLVKPGAAGGLTPNSNIGADYTPTYQWNKVPEATYYRLMVKDPASKVVLDQWYAEANICDVTTCSVVSPTTLVPGQHSWYVLTYNPAGNGPWSNNTQPTNFSTATSVPGAAVNLLPNSDIGANYTPTYTWDKVAAATYYRVSVNKPNGAKALDQWYAAADICNETTCSVVSPTLGGGTHGWYVQTYNPAGSGPWSNNTQPTNFTTSTTAPGAATNLLPNSNIGANYTPTYTWNKVAEATYYHVVLNKPGGTKALDQWYATADICDGTTCSVVSPMLGGGTHGWYVQTYNPAGYGPWSNNTQPTNFTTSTTAPGAATLTDPVDEQNIGKAYNPIYRWSMVDGATYYHVYVGAPGGKKVLDMWYLASSVCDAISCSVTSPTLSGGAHVWFVQTYGPGGYGPWSNGQIATDFYVDDPTVPAAATNLLPTGTTADTTPAFSWTKDPMATWYRLYVKGPNGLVLDKWYQAMDVCVGDACFVGSAVLVKGEYTWWVQTYNVKGYGPWKSATFKVSP